MKKIIVAICGIIMTSAAMAAAGNRSYEHPKISDDNTRSAWNWFTSVAYPEDVSYKISPKRFYNEKTGTFGTGNGLNYWGAEGSITPVIAREIYEHGGKFVMTQMQAAWTDRVGTGKPRWIDFFDQDKYSPEVICEPGWSGQNCGTQKYDCNTLNVDYTRDLNNPLDGKYRMTSGGETGRITQDVYVFDYLDGYMGEKKKLPPNGKFADSKTNDHYSVVLAAIKIKPHSVLVSPVKVEANQQTIKAAYSIQKKNYKLLCAPGYRANDAGDDCVLNEECDPSYIRFCEDRFNDDTFDESQHEVVIEDGCRRFVCKQGSDYVFKPGTLNCELCESTRYQGINAAGECEVCGKDQFFNPNTLECDTPKVITARELRRGISLAAECWMKTKPSEYKDCVLCKNGEYYDETEKKCKPKSGTSSNATNNQA